MIAHKPKAAAGFMSTLRYLIPTDPGLVSTYANCCESGCNNVARGGGVCIECTISEAPAAMQPSLRRYEKALHDLLDAAKELERMG